MTRTGLLLAVSRVALEAAAFLNLRCLFRCSGVSPAFVVYATHALCALPLAADAARHGRGLLRVVEHRTGVAPRRFVLFALLLSVAGNARMLLRLALLRHVSDTAAVALSSASVLFTRLLGRKDAPPIRTRLAVLAAAAGAAGVVLCEQRHAACACLLVAALASSVHSALFRRLVERRPEIDRRLAEMLQQKRDALRFREARQRDDVLLRSPFAGPPPHGLADAPRFRSIVLEHPASPEHVEQLQRVYATWYCTAFTGAATALLFWPLLLVDSSACWHPAALPRVLAAVLLNALLSLHHFAAVGLVSPVFAQVSALIFKAAVLVPRAAELGLGLQDLCALVMLVAAFSAAD